MKTYIFSELSVGMEESFKKTITEEDMKKFLEITGDKNPLHNDESYAKTTNFERRVVYGQLVNSQLSTMAGMYLPGKYSLILSINSNFKKPAFIGEELTIKGVIESKTESTNMIKVRTEIKNGKGEVVQSGEMQIKLLK